MWRRLFLNDYATDTGKRNLSPDLGAISDGEPLLTRFPTVDVRENIPALSVKRMPT